MRGGASLSKPTRRKSVPKATKMESSEKVENPSIAFPIFSLITSFVQVTRYYLIGQVELGTGVLLRIQKIRTPFLDKYFTIASLCGSEIFYLLMIPFLFWNVEQTLGRLIMILFAIGIYCGNFLKNMFCLPRPPSPPVWTPDHSKEVLDNRDYGWPSSHSINAVSLPFFMLRYFYGFVWVWDHPSPFHLSLMYTVAFLWSGSIIFSRLYLGVHSPADITGGMIIGALILRIYLSTYDVIDAWVISGRNVPWLMPLIAFGLLLIHPQTFPAKYTFSETTAILGTTTGVVIGSWYRALETEIVIFPAGVFVDAVLPWDFMVIGAPFLLKPLLRFILGALLLFGLHLPSKPLLAKLFSFFGSVRTKRSSDDDDLNCWETLVKFLSYSTIGWIVTHSAPLVFDAITLW